MKFQDMCIKNNIYANIEALKANDIYLKDYNFLDYLRRVFHMLFNILHYFNVLF